MSSVSRPAKLAPRILWPAPGLAAFIEGNTRQFTALVEFDGDADGLRQWLSDLQLQCAVDARRIALELGQIRAFDPATQHQFVGAYQRRSASPMFEVEMTVPRGLEPSPPRTAQVFHLCRAGVVERASAVALLAEGKRRLRLAFATDLHVSRAWDSIAAAIDRYTPELAASFCHPQRLLAAFVEACNGRAARGELDLVVLGGDLVDHVYLEQQGRLSTPSDDSNVQLLLELLAPLTVPLLAIPGNHDYRLNPWRPRVFGLGSIGLTPPQSRQLLKAAGLWEAWPLRPSDRTALHTTSPSGTPALREHWSELAPATDFSVDLRGTRLVFFATGRDMVIRWKTLGWRQRALLARGLPTSWHDPDSEGPSDEQMRWLEGVLVGARHAALFFHAPILNPPPGLPVEDRIQDIDPGDADGRGSDRSFERRLFGSGLRAGVSFRNVTRLVRTLLSVPGNVTTFSGHVHRASRIEIDRSSLRPRSAAFDPATNDPTTISLHIGAALGHVRAPGHDAPSYLLAELDAGTLRSVQRCFVSPLAT